jgi:peptidoglycan/LPS O-acetylase OafA/YrhL
MSSASLEVQAHVRNAGAGNIDSLTGIRFVAALTIALGHSYAAWDDITMIGMPLFFTLSGFIIHYVYSDTFATGWRSAAVKFAGARFSRIYPLYFILLLVALVTTPMGPILCHWENIRTFLAYLFACYTWFPLAIDGRSTTDWYYSISWSVPTEIFFYISYALVFFRLARIRSAKACLITLIVFCLAAYALFYLLFLTRDFWEDLALRHISGFRPRTVDFSNSLYRWFLYSSPYCRIFEFIGGCLTCQLFLLVRKNDRLRSRLNFEILCWLPCLLVVVVIGIYEQIAPYRYWLAPRDHGFQSFFVSLHMNFLLAPFCYLLIFSLAYGRSTLSRILSSAAVVFLGEISFSTYLGHPLAQSFAGNSALPHAPPASSIAGLVVIYIFSWMLYSAFEVPAKAGLRRFFALQPGRAVARFLGWGGMWAAAAAGVALLIAAVSVHAFFADHGKAEASAPMATVPSTVDQLPALPSLGMLTPTWDGIEGLTARRLDVAAGTNEDPLNLVATEGMGRHRLGIVIHGINSNHVYRVSAWIKAAAPVHVQLDLRDDKATHKGKAVFKLPNAAVIHAIGDVSDPGYKAESDGWTRVWADMAFTGNAAVVYVTLVDSAGSDEFYADGETSIGFGGIDLVQHD